MKTTIKADNFEFSFIDEDIIDIDDVMFADDYGGDIYNCDRLEYLGNAGEPFDLWQTLGYVEFPLPKKSIVRLYGDEIKAISYHV